MAVITRTRYNKLRDTLINRLNQTKRSLRSFDSNPITKLTKGELKSRLSTVTKLQKEFSSYVRDTKQVKFGPNGVPKKIKLPTTLYKKLTSVGDYQTTIANRGKESRPRELILNSLRGALRRGANPKTTKLLLNRLKKAPKPFSQPASKKGYIYKITEKGTGKSYIGQTIRSIKERFTQHFIAGREKNATKFDRILREKGRQNFTVTQLAKASASKLSSLERKYIAKFKATNSSKGFNTSVGTKATEARANAVIRGSKKAYRGNSTVKRAKSSLKGIAKTKVNNITRKR